MKMKLILLQLYNRLQKVISVVDILIFTLLILYNWILNYKYIYTVISPFKRIQFNMQHQTIEINDSYIQSVVLPVGFQKTSS